MTDTVSPITEPHLTPMFVTGAQPVQSNNTEPHPAPIFDTGPHPEPLPTTDDEAAAEDAVAEDDSVAEAAAALAAEPAPPQAFSELDNVDTDAFLRSVTGHMPSTVISAQPTVVPSAFAFVKRWKFALIVAGVWFVAAAAGLGFYFWWYTALDKTLPVFGILIYLVACMVASILVSMVPDRPRVTALAIALMSAPLASMGAAAVLHGAYYFEWITRPLVG
ncbi:MAG: hypothetical protein ACR2JM_03575 [Mycobacterium sp.]